MRFYEDPELQRQKCYFCGSKNKLVTNILLGGKKIGQSIRCCNCGHIDYHIFPWDDTKNTKAFYNNQTKPGPMRCIQPSFCPYKNCPLYGTSTAENTDDFTCDMHCGSCKVRYCEKRHPSCLIEENKKPNFSELESKTCNGPEYK